MADKRSPASHQAPAQSDNSQGNITTQQFPQSFTAESMPSSCASRINAHAVMNTTQCEAPGPGAQLGILKKKGLDISSLMSPPDPVMESFSQMPYSPVVKSTPRKGAKEPISPPVSPNAKAAVHALEAVDAHVADPILYPRDDASATPPQQPLFSQSESTDHSQKIDRHIANRDASLFRRASPPRREDYELALQFRSQVIEMFSRNRKAWIRKERELLVDDMKVNRERWNMKRYQTIAPAKPTKASIKTAQTSKHGRSTGAKGDRIVKPSQARPATAARPRPNPNQSSGLHKTPSATPEPGRRIVAPNREDRDFEALPDLCPPLSSLPDKPNSLKVDWRGAPVDLSKDPHAHLLHPDERNLAANLRLDCATYLTSKRRMFIRRLECARIPKDFRKTDAQQACKIDVNKASKLWTAFEKVGWLDSKWMQAHLA